MYRHKLLAISIHLLAGATLAATTGALAADDEPRAIEEIEVRALGVRESADKIATPFSIVDGQQLLERGGATLGDALAGEPGVHSDTFGAGASRPVIRGQTAPRVTVLSDGAALVDASGVSPDHAITADPLLASGVEVLRGPATLLYGGGAIGGVVNVLDNKIATRRPEQPLSGTLALRGNTVAGERAAALSATAHATDKLVLHLEGSHRDTGDYRAPGQEESRVEDTYAESRNAAGGVSWVGDQGYVGLAYSYRRDEYGLPGHSHEYDGCHPHGDHLHCGGHDHGDQDHGHQHDQHDDAPYVDLASRRLDLRAGYSEPFAGVERIELRASHTDYRHHELDEGEIDTTFTNKGYEGRVEVRHHPLAGWTGAVGMQYANTTFGAFGAEAFVPETDGDNIALFLVEHRELGEQWHLEAGARHERQKLKPVDDPRNRPAASDSATSLSAAAIWQFAPEYSLTFSAARSQRLAQAQELYARGIHLATNTYECGLLPHPLTCGGLENNDGDPRRETSHNLETRLRKTEGALTLDLGIFHNRVDNYIYARTLDRFEDFRLIKYTQRDATFTGVEAQLGYQFSQQWSATLFGDRVHARLEEGGNLPRISPARFGTRVRASYSALSGELELYRVARQTRTAEYENATPGYNMLNLSLSYALGEDDRYTLFLRGGNLLNEEVWNHTSFLANTVPLPGRNLSAGARLAF